MAKQSDITPEICRKFLRYKPETGQLFWMARDAADVPKYTEANVAAWNARFAGKEAFTTLANHGYKTGTICSKIAYAHRVIIAIVTGEWPDGAVDHINGCKTDNRIGNLRVVTNHENCRNQSLGSKNTSGLIGVYRDKHGKKWIAQINIDGRQIHLGTFATKTEAYEARLAANVKFGFHQGHGKPSQAR